MGRDLRINCNHPSSILGLQKNHLGNFGTHPLSHGTLHYDGRSMAVRLPTESSEYDSISDSRRGWNRQCCACNPRLFRTRPKQTLPVKKQHLQRNICRRTHYRTGFWFVNNIFPPWTFELGTSFSIGGKFLHDLFHTMASKLTATCTYQG